MSYIQPQSKIWLCKDVPLDPSYDNTMTFTNGTGVNRTWNKDKQTEYFFSKVKTGLKSTDWSIIKERDNVIRAVGNVGKYYDINYMIFTNSNFSDMYFYAFVTKAEYLNPNTTLVYFTLDVMQTWMPYLKFKESQIDREHVENDTPYSRNLEDEGLPIGELQAYEEIHFENYIGDRCIFVGATEDMSKIVDEGPYKKVYWDYRDVFVAGKEGKGTKKGYFYPLSDVYITNYYTYNVDDGMQYMKIPVEIYTDIIANAGGNDVYTQVKSNIYSDKVAGSSYFYFRNPITYFKFDVRGTYKIRLTNSRGEYVDDEYSPLAASTYTVTARLNEQTLDWHFSYSGSGDAMSDIKPGANG